MNWRNYKWIILGLLALLLNWFFSVLPSAYEILYLNGIFQVIRVGYDYTLGWMPFPMVYVLFAFVVHLIYSFFRFKKVKRDNSLLQNLKSIFLPIASLTGAVLFFFYMLWGFNYKQEALSTKLNLPTIKSDTTVLYEEASFFLSELERLRLSISQDSNALNFEKIPENLEGEIRSQLESLLGGWNIPTYGRVRVRALRPKGILLRISTAGVYIPFVFEGHIDAGLHPIQYPFTMAHEMSHGYGIADEGTCNFTGFLACMKSDDAMIQYSAVMGFWRYMANNLRRSAPESYKEMMNSMHPFVQKDLISIMKQMDKYPDILPDVRDAVYESYLKTHGVKGGLSNYSTVVKLVFAWKESGQDEQLKNKIYGPND